MLKHCPSLRIDRGEDRCSTYNKELEAGGEMGNLEGKGEKSENMTTSVQVCPNCGGQHSRLRVYRASPADHKQQQMMDFTTVLLSPTTTSAMVVEESLRR